MFFIKDILKIALKFIIGTIQIRLMSYNDTKSVHKNCWLFHGSTVDVFAFCSLYISTNKFGKDCILASIDHKSILIRFGLIPSPQIILISTDRCHKYRKFFSWSVLSTGVLSNLNQYFKIPHCVTNQTIYNLILQNRINFREALTYQMEIPRNTQYSLPKYSLSDDKLLESIFKTDSYEFSSMVLILPIAYTHGEFDELVWIGVVKAFHKLGFKCIFNLEKNFNDDRINRYSNLKNSVNIPADLVPLAASKVGWCVAGMGGGFDLLLQFSNQSRCILLHRNSNNDSKLNIPNYPLELLENKYLDDCGRMPNLIISLSGLEQSEDVENIISKSLKNIKINK